MNSEVFLVHCPKCNGHMPSDELHCIRCGFQLPPKTKHEINDSSDASRASTGNPVSTQRNWLAISGYDTRSARQINWTKVFAVVLTSKLFFLASCTGGAIAINRSGSGSYMDQGLPPAKLMSVIAVIPNPDKPGERKIVQIFLESLERFKQDNPNYSFVPPLGKGDVNEPLVEARTEYTVTTAEPGKVMVETKFDHDTALGGFGVLARYEATDKEIKPLYTKMSVPLVDFCVGFSLAFVLALVGYIFKWRLRRAVEGVAAAARP